MSNAYRARHTAPKSRSGRGTAVVAATGLLSTPALAAVPVFTAVGALAMATSASAATEIAVTNLAATLDTPASGSTINTTDTMKLSWSFDVPSGATEGDTSTFTLPNYVQGAPVSGMQVPDADGNIVGTLSGGGQTYTLTYSSYVNTHENVSVHITRTLSPIAAQWTNNTSKNISVTNGGNTAVGGQLTLSYSENLGFSESTTLAQSTQSAQPGFAYLYSTPYFKPADVGVQMTQTFNIDPGSQPNATFNCDAITGANGVRYFYGPDKGNLTGYFASSASDPLDMQVVSCTDTQVTITYTPTEAYKGFTLTLVGARVGTTGDAVLLTQDAIVNGVTGPYHVTTIRTSGATGVTTISSSSFNFGGAGGGGIQTPKASIVAYIADKTPNNPSGLTTDGQNSDANTAPGVSVLPGTTKVSLVIKNTGYVNQTGGVVKDSTGNVVATVPALAAGATTVVVIDATVAENAQFTETYSVVMSGPSSDSSPVSDPVNAKGIDVTPEASADSATTDYGTPVTIDVLGNDAPGTSTYPLDSSTLTLIDGSGDAVSTLTVTGGTYKVVDGKIVFTPAAKFTGTADTVKYRVADTLGNTASSTVSVTVKNVKPTAENDTATTEARTPVTVDVLANDAGGAADLPLDPSTLKLIDGSGNAVNSVNVAGGTYSVVGGKVVFTPDANFTGTAPSVRYQVSDELGNTVGATVTVAVKSVAPKAVADSATTPVRTPVTIDVLANDSAGSAAVPLVASSLVLIDGNGNAVTTLSVSGGTYSVVGGKVVFTPNADFAGTAPAATYRVSDDMGNTVSSTVSVDVTKVTPIARPDTANTYLNTSVTVDVLANDSAGAPNVPLVPSTLTLLDSNGNAVSSVRVNGGTYKVVNGKVVFTPDCNFSGTAPAVQYRITDDFGTSVSTTVQVTVEGCPPEARNDYASTMWGMPVTIDVLRNDRGGTNDPLVSSSVTLLDRYGNPVTSLKVYGGTYKVVNGKVVYTPDCWFLGRADAVKYQVQTQSGIKLTAYVQGSVGWC